MWQSCTEFGYWQVAPPQQSLRSRQITAQWHHEHVCHGLFGLPKTHEAPVERINGIYGGLAVSRSASRIVFTNGQRDPWYALGVRGEPIADQDQSVQAVALASESDEKSRWLIPAIGHCADLHQPAQQDPHPLTVARLLVYAEVQRWLSAGDLS